LLQSNKSKSNAISVFQSAEPLSVDQKKPIFEETLTSLYLSIFLRKEHLRTAAT